MGDAGLQWGRRNYPAETHSPPPPPAAARARFNGAAGITRRKQADRPLRYGTCCQASMGPPELPGGNSCQVVKGSIRQVSFNGAAGITRRKQTIRRRPRAIPVNIASMGPPELPGGNEIWILRCRALRIGFNGAAGITRRKPLRKRPAFGWDGASMGPPELPGGNTSIISSRETFSVRFNGAAGITRRKPRYRSHRCCTAIATLQWGRRNYPAETLYRRASFISAEIASMGPPELPGGNLLRGRNYRRDRMTLQWGRRNYPAETQQLLRADGFRKVASMGPPELPGGNANDT